MTEGKRVPVVLPPALAGSERYDIDPAYTRLREECRRTAKERSETNVIERWRAQTKEWDAIYKQVRRRMAGLEP